MKFRLLLATMALASASAFGMANKPKVTIRFHVETNALDGESVSKPLHLNYAQRDVHVSRMAAFSEANIKTIYPYRTTDGSWGCMIQLDPQGTINLDTVSNQARGSAMVVFVASKQGVHQVVDMTIDRSVSDGVITIPRGLTDGEIAVMRQQFKVIDLDANKVADNKKKPAPKPNAPKAWAEQPPANGVMPRPVGNVPTGAAPAAGNPGGNVYPEKRSVRKAGEPDLPRLAD
jgi:hypothetical protein